jgi:integrase
VDRAFRGALDRAGIDDFRFHDLGHTFASHLIMGRANLKEVQAVLGHKTMTLHDAHLSQEHKKRGVNFLNGLTHCVSFDMLQTVIFPKSVESATG